MAGFTVRVELHSATWEDYEKLHERMAAKGFAREIHCSDGNWYELPQAEYRYEQPSTAADVCASAKQAANSTGRTSGILVSQTTNCHIDGLAVVRAPVKRR